MQFFSGSRVGTHPSSSHLLLRHKAIILIVALAGVCALLLIVHAAQLSSMRSDAPFGIADPGGAPTGETNFSNGSTIPSVTASTIDVAQSTQTPIDTNESSTSLTVNNETVPVPDNGTVTKSVTTDSGQTSVQIQATNQTTNTSKRNSLRIQSSTHSSKTTTTQSTQEIKNEGVLQP